MTPVHIIHFIKTKTLTCSSSLCTQMWRLEYWWSDRSSTAFWILLRISAKVECAYWHTSSDLTSTSSCSSSTNRSSTWNNGFDLDILNRNGVHTSEEQHWFIKNLLHPKLSNSVTTLLSFSYFFLEREDALCQALNVGIQLVWLPDKWHTLWKKEEIFRSVWFSNI